MLSEIIDSKQESAILGFLLVAPERAFSLHELSRRLAIPHTKLALALGKLGKFGHLKIFSKKAKKYYLVNTKFKLYPELQNSLVKNQAKFEDELFVAIKKVGDIKAAFLSGIFSGHPELPVDILFVGKASPARLQQFLANCEKMMEQEINYAIMSEEEFEIRKHTFDRFIKDIFDYRHVVVLDTVSTKQRKRK